MSHLKKQIAEARARGDDVAVKQMEAIERRELVAKRFRHQAGIRKLPRRA